MDPLPQGGISGGSGSLESRCGRAWVAGAGGTVHREHPAPESLRNSIRAPVGEAFPHGCSMGEWHAVYQVKSSGADSR
jgi:hypothetical protein